MVSHSKCKKCSKILNVIELEDNPEGVGMVCIDKSKCKERQQKAGHNHA